MPSAPTGAEIAEALRARGHPARGLRFVTLAERPDLRGPMSDHNVAAWPAFMHEDPVAADLWHHLFDDFASDQVVLLDGGDRIVAALNSAPLAWDGTDAGLPAGWDEQFERTVAGLRAGREPDTLGALEIVVAPERRGDRLAGLMVVAMQAIARWQGYRALIACVRPTEKERYPLVPIDRYAAWRRADGLPFDPWIRLHVRLGGRVVRPSARSMTMTGTVAEWERWTGMVFPESGDYVVPRAASLVHIDRAADRGTYHDPNVWVVHDLGPALS